MPCFVRVLCVVRILKNYYTIDTHTKHADFSKHSLTFMPFTLVHQIKKNYITIIVLIASYPVFIKYLIFNEAIKQSVFSPY